MFTFSTKSKDKIEKCLLTFGAINALKTIDAIAFAKIARATTRAIVWTCCADTFGFAQRKRYTVRQQFVIVDGQKPAASVKIL